MTSAEYCNKLSVANPQKQEMILQGCVDRGPDFPPGEESDAERQGFLCRAAAVVTW